MIGLSVALVVVLLCGLLLLRVPVAFSILLAASIGLWMIAGGGVLLGILETATVSSVSSYEFVTVPMFLLMAEFVIISGIADGIFRAGAAWVGWMPGGLAIATALAGAGFGAISGSSTILRHGIQQLVRDAQREQFEIVLAEALDRISRDQADVATLFKHLKFAGVTIVTLAEGEISELHVGLKGTMNALFLKDLALKTHRGLRGRVEKGKAGGGLCYGYRVMKKLDAQGEPIRGDREIVPEEAKIIRRIFQEFATGKSPNAKVSQAC